MNTKHLFIPTKLNIEDFLSKHPGQMRHIDKYRYVINHLVMYSEWYKDISFSDGVPINMETLKKVIGKDYAKRVIDDLQAWGIIDLLSNYSRGSHSRLYVLNANYRSEMFHKYAIKDNRLVKNIIKVFLSNASPLCKRILEQLKKLKINESPNNAEAGKEGNKWNMESYVGVSTSKSDEFASIASERIRQKDFYVIRDRSVNRVHTTITNLRKDVRRSLVLEDGTKLVEVDVANSQPFIFAGILKQQFHPLPADVSKFINLTINGEFYDYLRNRIPEFDGLEKNKIKKALFAKVFYCNIRVNNAIRNNASRAFEADFPNVYAYILKEKSQRFQDFPTGLQCIESEIMIDGVLEPFMEKNPGIFITPIHDAFLVTEDYVSELKAAIEKRFIDRFGLAPTVRVKM